MNYIVSEEELFVLASVIWSERFGDRIAKIPNRRKYINDFLKSKKPVTEIATGKVTQDLSQLDIWFINGKQINSLFKKYNGKSIKIFIEEI